MKVTILGKNGPKMADLNRRKAIRERCLNCAGWYHKEATNCTFTDCPLHPFRSGQGKQNAKDHSKAIRESVELDAIPAKKLRELITECIEQHIDNGILDRTMMAEDAEKQTLENIMCTYRGVM